MPDRPEFYKKNTKKLFYVDFLDTVNELGLLVHDKPFVRVYPTDRQPCPKCNTTEWGYMKDTGEVHCMCGAIWNAREH